MPVDEKSGKYTMNPGHGKAIEKARKSDKRKLESINITVAENGYTARVNLQDPPSKAGAPTPYIPAKEHVFSSKDKLLSFVTDQLS
jgi:hypothetical protein